MSANKINTISFNIDVAPKAHDMGRNLLRGAGLGTLDTITEGGVAYRSVHSQKDNMQAVVDGIDGNKGYQITTGSDEHDVYRGVFFIAAVNKGETYTLSAWVKGTAGNTLCMEFINNNGTDRKNSDGTSGTCQSATLTLTDGWQRVSHTFTVDSLNAGYVECNFFTNEPGTFTICEPKLERGDVATAFCLNEADLAAAVYEVVLSPIFNASYSLHTDDSGSADNNALDLTISGGFSVYTVVDGVRKLYEGDDLSFVLIAVPYIANGKVANGTGTVSLSQSNIDAGLAPVTAYLEVSRGTKDSTLATKNITISMHPNVLIDTKNGLLVKVNDNTKSIGTIKDDGKTISAKVQEIGDGLLATGVDISKHKFIATADNFTVRNNSGDQTFSIDEKGNIVGARDAYFKGTITGSVISGSTIKSEDGTYKTTIQGGSITTNNIAASGGSIGEWTIKDGGLTAAYGSKACIDMRDSKSSFRLDSDKTTNGGSLLSIYNYSGRVISIVSEDSDESALYIRSNGNARNLAISTFGNNSFLSRVGEGTVINRLAYACVRTGDVNVDFEDLIVTKETGEYKYPGNVVITTNYNYEQTVKFPANPVLGVQLIVIQGTNKKVHFDGNGHSFQQGTDVSSSANSNQNGQWNLFIFDGQYWQCIYITGHLLW